MEVSRALTCNKCKKSVDISRIRYVPKSEGGYYAVCQSCVDGGRNQASSAAMSRKERQERQATDDMDIRKFFCGKCGYKFNYNFAKRARFNLKCPYCGESSRLEPDRTDAASIVDDASRDDFDDRSIGPSARFYGKRF